MKNKILRIAFMGTPDFAVPALQALAQGPHDVVCAYTQPPRPKGRGQKVQPSPIHIFADDHGIPVHHPKSLKSTEEQTIFAGYNLDLAIVAAYGLILPKTILDAPEYGCINIHASLLPRWRGASPIQHAIWKGDEETGVTLMQMDEGLDTGDELMKRSIPITGETTAQSLHDDLAQLGGEMLIEALENIETLTGTPQDNEKSTYAPLLTKEDGRIDWTQSASEIDRQIRALNPWPGTYTQDGFKIKHVQVSNEMTTETPGRILDKKGHTACGHGTVLQLKTLQPAGKQAMDFAGALNGGYIQIGDLLS